jgi:small redox-active disulfide protein 2
MQLACSREEELMKEVKILGPGCPRCEELVQRTQDVVDDLGIVCTVTKVTDIMEITAHGVMTTPALVVDGTVKVMGRVPTVDEIKGMLS